MQRQETKGGGGGEEDEEEEEGGIGKTGFICCSHHMAGYFDIKFGTTVWLLHAYINKGAPCCLAELSSGEKARRSFIIECHVHEMARLGV